MPRRIVIVQGHPDPSGARFGHMLAACYLHAALAASHQVELLDVSHLEFPILRTKEDFEGGEPCPDIAHAQTCIRQADHLVFFFPLWQGEMPALLKGFLEQLLRPGFVRADREAPTRLTLRGTSARIVATMGMPAWAYRWWFQAAGVRNLRRNILAFCGIAPIRTTLIGSVETHAAGYHQRWLDQVERLGAGGR